MTLVPDVTAMKQSLTAVMGEASVNKTLTDFANTDLSLEDSIPGAILDVNFPDIYAAVIKDQTNTKAFLKLDNFAITTEAIQKFSAIFQRQSEKMIDILAAAAGSALSKTQLIDLRAAMGKLVHRLGLQQAAIETSSDETTKLSDIINAPDDGLQHGQTEIENAIAATNVKLKNMQDMLNHPDIWPPSALQGAARAVPMYQGEISSLTNLQTTLNSLEQANGSMGTALSQNLMAWKTLATKYQAIDTQLNKVGNGDSILAVGDIKSAQSAWSELEQYAKTLR